MKKYKHELRKRTVTIAVEEALQSGPGNDKFLQRLLDVLVAEETKLIFGVNPVALILPRPGLSVPGSLLRGRSSIGVHLPFN